MTAIAVIVSNKNHSLFMNLRTALNNCFILRLKV